MKSFYTQSLTRLLLAVVVLMSPSAIHAQAIYSSFAEGGFLCNILSVDTTTKSGEIEITGTVSEVGETLEIPASLKHNYADGEWSFTVTAIGLRAFAESKSLKVVKFPPLAETSLTTIGPLAFHHCTSLESINLEDTKIMVLESLFTENMSDEVSFSKLKAIKLPESLKVIKKYALQFLDITTITFPSSITTLEDRVLEGCIYLKEFIWEHCKLTRIPQYTFWGDDKLERVVILTDTPLEIDGLTDMHFAMCDKDVLRVYVSYQSYLNLLSYGYSPENAKYSTLVPDMNFVDGIEKPQVDQYKATQDAPSDLRQGIYTLQGTRISAPHKGSLYIRNGHKYIAR